MLGGFDLGFETPKIGKIVYIMGFSDGVLKLGEKKLTSLYYELLAEIEHFIQNEYRKETMKVFILAVPLSSSPIQIRLLYIYKKLQYNCCIYLEISCIFTTTLKTWQLLNSLDII